MANFTLTAVAPEHKEWTGQYGTFHIFDVEFEGEQGRGQAQIKQKATSPPPTVGQTIDAEIVHKGGNFPPELKRVQQGQNGGGGSRGKSPQESAQIARMNAHSQALHWLDVKNNMGTLKPLEWSEYLQLVDAFFNDIRSVS